jgi:hypothetical protein
MQDQPEGSQGGQMPQMPQQPPQGSIMITAAEQEAINRVPFWMIVLVESSWVQ